MLNFTTNQMI